MEISLFSLILVSIMIAVQGILNEPINYDMYYLPVICICLIELGGVIKRKKG